jgi:hypothetical protein
VRLEQPVVDVGDGRAGDVLVEAPSGVGHGEVPEHAPESLDRPDPGQGTDGGLGDPLADEELRLLDGGEVLRPGLERDIEDRGRELFHSLLLPCLDGRPAMLGPGRDVRTVLVESAVAAHAIDDQRLDDVVVGQGLGFGVLGLQGSHRRLSGRSRCSSRPARV